MSRPRDRSRSPAREEKKLSWPSASSRRETHWKDGKYDDDPNVKDRNWCITCYNDNGIEWDPTSMRYLVFQKERCPDTGRIHFQGFVIWKGAKNMRATLALLPEGSYVARMRAHDPVDAANYCKKEESRVEGPWEFGDPPKRQGSRSDIERATTMIIKDKLPIREVALQAPTVFVKYHRGLQALASKVGGHRTTKTKLFILHGPTGTGKSCRANLWAALGYEPDSTEPEPDPCSELPDKPKTKYIKDPRTHWWDDYEGEESVLIEDFIGTNNGGTFEIDDMLRLADRYEHTVRRKGIGSVNFCSRRIYITSNLHWRDWWPTAQTGQVAAFERRIDKCTEYKAPLVWAPVFRAMVQRGPILLLGQPSSQEEGKSDAAVVQPPAASFQHVPVFVPDTPPNSPRGKREERWRVEPSTGAAADPEGDRELEQTLRKFYSRGRDPTSLGFVPNTPSQSSGLPPSREPTIPKRTLAFVDLEAKCSDTEEEEDEIEMSPVPEEDDDDLEDIEDEMRRNPNFSPHNLSDDDIEEC